MYFRYIKDYYVYYSDVSINELLNYLLAIILEWPVIRLNYRFVSLPILE
jgi:hypothetical protein